MNKYWGNSQIAKYTGEAHTNGPMAINTWVIGSMASEKVKESIRRLVVTDMRGISKMERKVDRAK